MARGSEWGTWALDGCCICVMSTWGFTVNYKLEFLHKNQNFSPPKNKKGKKLGQDHLTSKWQKKTT